MLPPALETYFHQLCAEDFGQACSELTAAEEGLRTAQAAQGENSLGSGYLVGLEDAYMANLRKRGAIIFESLRRAHEAFHSPIDAGAETRMVELAALAIDQQIKGLKGSFHRSTGRMGRASKMGNRFDLAAAAEFALAPNRIRQMLWRLRNLPAPATPSPGVAPTSITIQGNVAALQTGHNSTANVEQYWVEGGTDLVAALEALAAVIRTAPGLTAEVKSELLLDVQMAGKELKEPAPNTGKLLRWLGGVGAVVQTVGSAQPAWEAVKAAAKVLGMGL